MNFRTCCRSVGTDVQSWMNLQTHYDIYCAEGAVGKAILKIAPRGTDPKRR